MNRILIAIAILLSGVAVGLSLDESPQSPASPPVIMEVLDPSLDRYSLMWRDEISRRSQNAVGVMVHGGDVVKGVWLVRASIHPGHATPIEDVIGDARRRYPDRAIFLISCNPGNVILHGWPNVFYFTDSVFCIPDRALTPEMFTALDAFRTLGVPTLGEDSRWELMPDVAGNVWESIEAR